MSAVNTDIGAEQNSSHKFLKDGPPQRRIVLLLLLDAKHSRSRRLVQFPCAAERMIAKE
jgi:hypothetical protein